MSSLAARRGNGDLTKLMMAGYEVEQIHDEDNWTWTDSCQEFFVKFQGPQDTLYEGATYKIQVGIPDQYPYYPPSLAFVSKVYHPNIDEKSGSICLDVINQSWTPLYSLINVFQVFIPQLLTYPNMADPLNTQAASTWMRDRSQYEEKVKEYVRLYATGSKRARAELEETTDATPDSKRTRTESEETTDASSDDNVSELSEVDVVDDLDLDMDL
jgi:ubiquitin-protein ligase